MPWPKKAIDIITITSVLFDTQFAVIIQLESSRPEMIGSFLLIFTDAVFSIIYLKSIRQK
jgi:hypothetical protein